MACDILLPGLLNAYYCITTDFEYYIPSEDLVRLQSGLTFYQIDQSQLAFKQVRTNDAKGTYFSKSLEVTVNNFAKQLDTLENNSLSIILEDTNNVFYIFGHDQRAKLSKKEDTDSESENEVRYVISQASYSPIQYVATTGITFSTATGDVTYSFDPVAIEGSVTDAQNVGGGLGLFLGKTSTILQFKTLVAGSNITIVPSGNTLIFNAEDGGITGNFVSASTFNLYTGTTAPNTYALKSKFNTYTGTTAPLTYQSKSSIVLLTGTTLPATYVTKALFNPFSASTDTRLDNLEALTGSSSITAENGLTKFGNKIKLGGTITGLTELELFNPDHFNIRHYGNSGSTEVAFGGYTYNTEGFEVSRLDINNFNFLFTVGQNISYPTVENSIVIGGSIGSGNPAINIFNSSGTTTKYREIIINPHNGSGSNAASTSGALYYSTNRPSGHPSLGQQPYLRQTTGGTTGDYLTKGITRPIWVTPNFVLKPTFATYTGTTAPLTYQSKSSIVTLTGTTLPATYQSKSSIVVLTGTTLPATYQSKSSIVTLTGTTLPATYQSKASIVVLTGTTLPATYKTVVSVNAFTGSTITGGTNGITKTINRKARLGGTLTGSTVFTDNRVTKSGLEYAANYSTGFTKQSLVDKMYVTGYTNSLHPFITYDDVNKKMTISGVNTSSSNYTLQINDSSSAYIARFRNDKALDVGGTTSQITFSGSSGGNGIVFPTAQAIAYYEQDSANNVFRRIQTTTADTRITIFKTQVIDQLSGDAPQVIKQYQTTVSATNSGVTTIATIAMPVSGSMMTIKADFIVIAPADGHGGGSEVVSTIQRTTAGTVQYVGSAVKNTERRSTGTWVVGIKANDSTKTADIRFFNDTVSSKSYKITVNVTYTLTTI